MIRYAIISQFYCFFCVQEFVVVYSPPAVNGGFLHNKIQLRRVKLCLITSRFLTGKKDEQTLIAPYMKSPYEITRVVKAIYNQPTNKLFYGM